MPPTVLVLEDEFLNYSEIIACVTDCGYKAVHFTNAEDALNYLKANAINLALIDIVLSGKMDGIEFSKNLPINLPVIFLSDKGRHREAALQTAGQRHFTYLPKPIDFSTLRVAIEIAIEVYQTTSAEEKPDVGKLAQQIEYLRQYRQLPVFAIPTPVKEDWKYNRIDIQSIAYFSAYYGDKEKYEGIELHTIEEKYFIPGKSIVETIDYLQKIGYLEFYQINRTQVINFNFISSYKPSKTCIEIELIFGKNKKIFTVTKTYKEYFNFILKKMSFKF